ncbi:putative phage abortive infection protein [Vibrio splendidus]|uniref:putative phage abortive infection protein n=1 Tax=Vibrio splendidus TaxID=29497 RepID=UPI001E3B51A6|nr:putative phage abortive infection protein [Vibrio splendidus]MCC4791186.1 putative phage abortive infection protein [Vibrio splendidus]
MKYKWIFSILIFTAILPIGLYLFKFNDGLSNLHSEWGEFGSFFGGVVSPIISILAFIGLLYSMDETKKQFSEQRDESAFYSLLNFHSSKVEQLTNHELKGYELFKYLSMKYDVLYDEYCFNLAKKKIINNTSELPYFSYDFLSEKIKENYPYVKGSGIELAENYFNLSEDKHELLKGLIDASISDEDKSRVSVIGDTIVRKFSSEQRLVCLKEIYDEFYHDYGYLVGHYFRNINYILEHVDKSFNKENYSKIFRAQLSRYELTLLYYNMTSSYSSDSFNKLINRYNILNGIYQYDICYQPEVEVLENDLKVLHKVS